jgi:asparagine synthase (glutamine-hydrolysing)
MCGINGILRLAPGAEPVDREELLRTRDHMTVRGPDGAGLWVSPDQGVGLAHRRLAIIDLSEAGLQPMARGRYRIVFNGEIYNYRELRRDLIGQGEEFVSHSDTEVVLALYAREGLGMLARLRGMYAFAVWDEVDRKLVLARDPYGIKPLYYALDSNHLRFASQVKALEAGGMIDDAVDPAGLVGFLLWGSVPEPHTLRRGVRCLQAGHHLVVEDGRPHEPRSHHRFVGDRTSGGSDPAHALEGSVRAHLVSDVPVAVFLSSGLDSSLIAALASREIEDPPTTLTLRFDAFTDTPFDEAPLAAEVARSLGTRHVERFVQREDFLDLWPSALAAMDQPSVDGFNTYVVSRAAHDEGFKVVLSGVGGDELFGGYASFPEVPRWSRWARVLDRVPGLGLSWPVLSKLRPATPKLAGLLDHGTTLPGAYFLRRALYLPSDLPRLVGTDLAREGLEAYDPVADCAKYLGAVEGLAAEGHGSAASDWEAVHLMESTQYMRNQLLRDSDWASMAHSLELRTPLVDARLHRDIANGNFEPGLSQGKAAAIRLAAPGLPPSLWTRPKTGFYIPVMQWLDEQVHSGTSLGMASRKLALRVLDAFGVNLAGPGRGLDGIA